MNIYEWATRWGISTEALRELVALTSQGHDPNAGTGSESRVQSLVRLEAADHGVHLFRNNVGAGKLENGNFIRWGLANDSKKLNAVAKSADLIGLRPVRITDAHVGRIIGQFVSRECKAEGWKWGGDEHEQAQLTWANIINACGGDARMVSGKGSFEQ